MVEIKINDGEYTKYEIARMIGSRALQISMGAPFLIKLTPKINQFVKRRILHTTNCQDG